MTDGGHFGYWFTDEYGLPAYEYTCYHESDPRAVYTTTYGSSRDHWHQLGNDRINVLAHNDCTLEVMEGSRGPQWLVKRDGRRPYGCGGIAIIQSLSDEERWWSDLYSPERHAHGMRRVFGTGYFRKSLTWNDFTLDHAIHAPCSDDAVILSELRVTNNSDTVKELIVRDFWGVNLRSIIGSLIYSSRGRVHYGQSHVLDAVGTLWKAAQYLTGSAPEQVRDRHSSKLAFRGSYLQDQGIVILTPDHTGTRPAYDEPAVANYYPQSVFLACLSSQPNQACTSVRSVMAGLCGSECNGSVPHAPTSEDDPCLSLAVKVSLGPGESDRQSFLFGYADEGAIPETVKRYGRRLSPAQRSSSPFPFLSDSMTTWKERLVNINIGDESSDWIGREARWHSYYMRSAVLYDDYFENHFLPQGGAYCYLQGLHGAPRDLVLFSIASVYTAPDLARETLEYVLRMMTPNGKLAYMTHGFGMLGGALVHNRPSDVYLFLLWGLSEYIFGTRDFEFLGKHIPFYPRSEGLDSTVYERILLALDSLFDRVGLGEHGLFRVGDGDWNDGISMMVRNRRKFLSEGESMFNSAFALYVLPRVASLLQARGETDRVRRLTEACHSLKTACLDSWNGTWFYRGWDGNGAPIGDKNIFLEPLTWLLISGVLSDECAKNLIHTVSRRLDEPSIWGQYLVYPPYRTPAGYLERGCDVNGGTWPAMSALLTWGYSRYSPELAWRSLVKNSMAHHSRTYPDIWYGIWSGPDSFNSSYSRRPGETYYNFATPTTDFPVMNLNLHACYLLALLKIMVEPDAMGISFPMRIPFGTIEIRTPVFQYVVADRRISGSFAVRNPNNLRLRFPLPVRWQSRALKLAVNGHPVQYDTDGGYISVTVSPSQPEGRFWFDLSLDS